MASHKRTSHHNHEETIQIPLNALKNNETTLQHHQNGPPTNRTATHPENAEKLPSKKPSPDPARPTTPPLQTSAEQFDKTPTTIPQVRAFSEFLRNQPLDAPPTPTTRRLTLMLLHATERKLAENALLRERNEALEREQANRTKRQARRRRGPVLREGADRMAAGDRIDWGVVEVAEAGNRGKLVTKVAKRSRKNTVRSNSTRGQALESYCSVIQF